MWHKALNRPTHPAWCFAWFAIGVIVGIGLVVTVDGPVFSAVELLAASAISLIYALYKRTVVFLVLAMVAGLLFGFWRGGVEHAAQETYGDYFGHTVVLAGRVNEDPAMDTNAGQRLRLASIRIGNQSLPGAVWMTTTYDQPLKRGDVVVIEGRLTPGFGVLPAAIYKATVRQVTEPKPGDVARRVRDWFAASIRRAIPEPEASLSVGYLVGQRSALPEQLSQQLRVVGLTHAVVASGYNLTILVGGTRRLFARYSKYLATMTASLMVMGFVLITGFSPSMSRAGLVSLLGLYAWYYGRTMHPVVLLSVAAATTAVWRPSYVWGDLGWYLSFTAFIGVIVLAPLIRRYFLGATTRPHFLVQTLFETTAAQIMTLPIILYAFGEYATYALLANILVLPLVPLAMLLTFVAGVGALLVPGLANWFGWPAQMVLTCNVLVIERVSKLPSATGEITFGLGALIISYILLFFGITYMWRVTKYNFRNNFTES